MVKKLSIIGLVLTVSGAGLFSWLFISERREQQQIAQYKLRYDSELDDYIEWYEQWSQLPTQQHGPIPTWQDNYKKTKTQAQLRQNQKERLKVDLEGLAAGEIDVHPFADVLYGQDWQQELKKYKTGKELREFTILCSLLCSLVGTAILTCCLLIVTARVLIRLRFNLGRCWDSIVMNRWKRMPEQPGNTVTKQDKECLEQGQEHGRHQTQTLRPSRALVDSRWQDFNENYKKWYCSDEQQRSLAVERKTVSNKLVQTSQQSNKALDSTLRELTDQVSAIREYAVDQQDRVRKLQDGYDWNIIRKFCLCIIRSIDNIESRIAKLSKSFKNTGLSGDRVNRVNCSQNSKVLSHLEEIKDELIFALESSGMERFEPKINSDYRGQEKRAEVIKEKEHCDNHGYKGKIAKVIRAGYQYIIDEETIKIVRPAQVKLFG